MAVVGLIDLNAKRNRRRHYETIFIVAPGEKTAKEICEKNATIVTDNKGNLLRQDDWGKKKMAYEIEKHNMGHYYYFRFTSTSDVIKALERSLQLDASVLRYKTIRLSEILSEQEEKDLIEKAPSEESQAPSFRREDSGDYRESYNKYR